MSCVSIVSDFLSSSGILVDPGIHFRVGVRPIEDQEACYSGGDIHLIGASSKSEWLLRDLSERFSIAGIAARYDIDECGVKSVIVSPDDELEKRISFVSRQFEDFDL